MGTVCKASLSGELSTYNSFVAASLPLRLNSTLRDKRTVRFALRNITDPGHLPIHKVFPQDLLIVVIAIVFAIIQPVVLLPCLFYFFCSKIVWTHQYLYVYESCYESGGEFWPKCFSRYVFALSLAQATIVGQFMLKGAFPQAYCTILLMIFTYFYTKRTKARYYLTSSSLPLEIASIMDINLNGQDPLVKYSSVPSYLQPSLRCSLNAIPEFPCAIGQITTKIEMDKYSDDGNIEEEEGNLSTGGSAASARTSIGDERYLELITTGWLDGCKSHKNSLSVAFGFDNGSPVITEMISEFAKKEETARAPVLVMV